MADTKRDREKQARDDDDRQRQREVEAGLVRDGETEPPIDQAALEEVETELDSLDFPASGQRVVAVIGDRTVESTTGTYTVDELVPETDTETFHSPSAVRVRVQRPTVAAAMKQVLEAIATLPNVAVQDSQRDAYEKTFRELKAIDVDDDDEGIQVMTEWIIDRIEEKDAHPGSRSVRRQAAKYARSNGYEIRNDEWLGV